MNPSPSTYKAFGPAAADECVSVHLASEKEFAEARDEWNALLEKSATNEFFLLWEWVSAWWEGFKSPDKRLCILFGRNSSGDTIGIAPFYVEGGNPGGVRKKKVARLCSSHETYPDHLDFICAREYGELFPEAVFKYFESHGEQWDVIRLDGVKEDSVLRRYLTGQRGRPNNFLMESREGSVCPYLPIGGSFKEYLNTFSGKTRQTILRKKKILFEREGVVFKVAGTPDELEKGLDQLFHLHYERAKRKNIASSFCSERIFDFHKKFTGLLFAQNKIILAFLYKGSEPIASWYCIRHANKYYYYQSGLSDLGEQKSAGSVLLALLIEKAFDERCVEFDFLRGEEEYKFFWTQKTRSNHRIVLRKNNLHGRFSALTSNAYHLIRSLKR